MNDCMSNLTGACCFACVVVGGVVIESAADTLHVPGQFATIQAAIESANDGDLILVAAGTYTGAGNTNVSFLGRAVTVRCDAKPGDCIIDGEETARGFIMTSGEGSDSILDGFSIVNGRGAPQGGGIEIQNSYPTIKNCLISNCYGWNFGGAIAIVKGSPTIVGTTFAGNYVDWAGGAISIQGGQLTVRESVFNGNLGLAAGGGIYAHGGLPIQLSITDCVFSGNQGAGIHIQSGTSTESTVINSLFTGNMYGGIRIGGSSAHVINSTFFRNAAPVSAGIHSGSGSAIVENSIIWANMTFEGNPMQINEMNLRNNVANHSIIQGGWLGEGEGTIDEDPLLAAGLSGSWTAPAVFDPDTGNTVFTDDNAVFEPGALAGRLLSPNDENLRLLFIEDNAETTITVRGNLTSGYSTGPWAHTPNGDETYQVFEPRPAAESPAIDAGNDDALPPDITTDLDGNPRFVGKAVDIGPFEFQGSTKVGDLNGDGVVNVLDLLILLEAWGECADPDDCLADLNNDGIVNVLDLLILLENWG